MKVFGIVGRKNSGKTHLVTRLVRLASARSLRVSTVKHAHHAFDVDRPDDILTLLADGRRGRTREVCLQMDLGARLRA
mgnify:CR=1 FL=1